MARVDQGRRWLNRSALLAVLGVALLLSACASDREAKAPDASTIVLADQNRFVWLGEQAEDQATIMQALWEPLQEAQTVEQGSAVTSGTVNTVMMTGSLAGMYFRNGLPEYEGSPTGVLIVIKPGEAEGVKSGDILHMYPKATYRIVSRLPADALAEARYAAYHRMGLE